MNTTEETRRGSYEQISNSLRPRHQIILKILGDNKMTAHEITTALFENGYATHYERNFAAPRLTELKGMGLVTVVGKKKSPVAGRNVAVWARTERA